MSIKFITGNKNKFEEVKNILGLPLEQLDIDLSEIQEIDAREVLRQKLRVAEEHGKGEYIVEDTSLYLFCLGGKLPGPLVKWFEKAIGNDGFDKTFGEMTREEKHKVSMRGAATSRLKEFLERR